MITYSELGKNGRLGNQMFQYATLFSVGFLRGQKIAIPKNNHQLFSVFSMTNAEIIPENYAPKYRYEEPNFLFSPNIFMAPDKTDIHGYFQSPGYFNHCEKSLRKEFTFHKKIQENAKNLMTPFEGKNICSLHVRRGDYLSLSGYHTNLGTDYYQEAINIVIQNIPDCIFLVFSDDIEWCKNIFSDDRFYFAEDGDDATEMCMMSMCTSHIIANSSFSWWGAWLSNSSGVIAPKKWFSSEGPSDWSSIYRSNWVTI
tara:strand:- start:23912 stop:24679 length:768 start_codon:yes stop_codon:yes gene_type:complete